MSSPYVSVLDAKPALFQSPPPTRGPTPVLQPNPYLDAPDDYVDFGHRRTRIRPDRIQKLDPEDFLFSKLGDSPASYDQAIPKVEQTHYRDTEYSYPTDEPGEEMSEAARVWRIYVDEAGKFDSSLTEGWNRGVDVLLVFTGLFSAVLTTFIIQAFELLIPDPGETTNALLERLVSLQTNIERPVSSPSPSPTPGQVVWVNGVWFAALACSLSTALVSMLAKQWLQVYTTNISGSPRQRARQRQKRWMELMSWHVLTLLNALPLLLHVALLLFFAGIVVLLWSLNRATTFVTLLIVAFAYIFYFASIWLPIIYPNCPYQHPISDHLRRLIFSKKLSFFAEPSLNASPEVGNAEGFDHSNQRGIKSSPDDLLDASALVWLLTRSTDKYVVAAALQAIAGLPRDFSATHILRAAGAVRLVEKGFQFCFEKDTTIDLKWHLIDADEALLYCKAWMCLTRGSSEKWPFELVAPLWKLQDLKKSTDTAAIASCVVAVSSVESHVAQWELLAYISRYVAGEIQLSHSTLCWLLDSMVEGLSEWEMPTAVVEKTTIRAVPILLRLLKHIEDLPTSSVRSAAGLALYVFTCQQADLHAHRSEDDRRASHCSIMVKALSSIVATPERFDVDNNLFDIVVHEFSRLATPLVSQSHRFSRKLKGEARSSLLLLFMSGRIAIGIVPDPILADVLHLLNKAPIPAGRRSALVKILLETLQESSHQDVASWSVRLLRPLLSGCPMPVVQAFTENEGISAVLRAAKIGDIDNRRLQVDSWRTLHDFVNSTISLYLDERKDASDPDAAKHHFESIFKSKLFETACAAILSHQWWLFEVSGQWVPTFVKLCSLRPHDSVWKSLIKVVQDTNEKEMGGEYNGMSDMLYQLEPIIQRSPKRRSSELDGFELDDNLSTHTVTMMEQRLAMKTPSSALLQVSDGSSIWF